jgi:uncharacterized protein YndB with AHSA1/START domain
VASFAYAPEERGRERPFGQASKIYSVTEDAYTSTVRIAAPPVDVFPYLTDPELLVRWMGDWASLDPSPGGQFTVDINGVPIRGSYVLVEPPHRLVLTWGAAGDDSLPPGSTTVEISLLPDGDGTVLELVHRNLPPEQLPKHGIGWRHFLDRLASAGSGGNPGPDPWAEV